MKIQTVSSRWTFLLKVAFPLLWLIIMGGISALVLISPLESLKEPFSPMAAKSLVLSFYALILVVFYLMFGTCKWVGMTDSHTYVSNFFKNYKYTHDSISSFEEANMLLFTKVTLHFHQSGKFGKSVSFIKSHYWKYFLEKHPNVLEAFTVKSTIESGNSDKTGTENTL